jgi:enoyl-CoA hydratase/carnithine racemase
MLDEPVLLRDDVDGVVRLTLNRPSAFNSLSKELLLALLAQLETLGEDSRSRVIVIRATGTAFCAGHDLKEMGAGRTRARLEELFGLCSRFMLGLTRLPQPVIACVDGIATAAGCQLVAACDLAICSATSRFATSGIRYGLFCATPMVPLSRVVPRKAALEMLLTGDFVDAGEALRLGLVNQVVPNSELDAALHSLCDRLLDKPPAVLALGKRAFYEQIDQTLDQAYATATRVIVDNALGDDFAAGLEAFMAKGKPVWPAH